MNYFYPHAMAQRVYQITPQLLKSWGVKGLILDIDNTLTTHDNPIPDAGVSAWLEQNRREGIAMIVLSNNKPERVEPFAKILGLDYISNGAKPLKKGYQRCAQTLNIPCEQLCMVGDQLFTDILGGNCAGCKTVLVSPIQKEKMFFQACIGAIPVLYLPEKNSRQHHSSGQGIGEEADGSKIWTCRKFGKLCGNGL
jgi:HAD superfamily phosphatase (TIGR01668 family)